PLALLAGTLFVVVKIFVLVIFVLIVVQLGFEDGDKIAQLDRCTGAIATLFSSANFGLFICVGGQYTVGNRNTGCQGDLGNGRSAFIADHFKVVGVAADNGAQSDQGIKLAGFGHLAQSNAQFQRARYGQNSHVALVHTQSLQLFQAGFQFGQADGFVKTCTHNTNVQTFPVQVRGNNVRIHVGSSA